MRSRLDTNNRVLDGGAPSSIELSIEMAFIRSEQSYLWHCGFVKGLGVILHMGK